MMTLEMERKRKKKRKTPEAMENENESCLRWDSNPQHSVQLMYGLYFVETEVESQQYTYTQLTWLRIVNWFCNQRCWIDSKLGRWTRSRCSHT